MSHEPKLCPGCFLEAWTGGPCTRCGYRLDPESFPTALQPGTVLAKYTVGRVLGKPGGFGITYLAFDPVLERRLALKELMPRDLVARRPDGQTLQVQTRDDQTLFEYTRSSFLQEARLIAQLNHQNLVRVLDYFEANGTAYFAMEYYEGETLAEYVRRSGGRLPGEEALALMLPLLAALEHIHTRDEPIVHRDIKPANIYLTGGRTPILLDFGAARIALGQQSRSLSAVLTPGYAPYEQYSTRGNQGPWTDVYGCAATLYFLVTGQTPPEASLRIENPRIEPPHRLVPGLSPTMGEAIVRGLGFKPQDRPQSARAFADLLTGRVPPAGAAAGPAAGPDTEIAPDTGTWDAGTEVAPGTDPADAGTEIAPGTRWGADAAEIPVGAAAPAAPAGAGVAATGLGSAPPGGRARGPNRVLVAGIVAALILAGSVALGLSLRSGEAEKPDPDLIVMNGHGEDAEDLIDPELPPVDEPNGGGRARVDVDDDRAPPDEPEREPPTERPAPAPAPAEPPAAAPAPTARPAPTPTAAPASGVLVIVYGDEHRSTQQAENVILRALLGQQGLRPLEPQSLSMIRGDQAAVEAAGRGDFAALAALGREHGAEFLVVGDLSARAAPSVGRFFAGTAEMDLKMYRVSTGALVDANTFRVGSGGTQSVLAPSEAEARSRAAEEAGNAAADAARLWLRRALR